MRWMAGLGYCLLLSCAQVKNTHSPDYLVQDDGIQQPLIEVETKLDEGARLFSSREAGHCVLCHQIDSLDAPFQGNLGPDLSTVGSRLSPAQLRLRIVDASRLNPGTIMPPYYRTAGLTQVAVESKNTPVLNRRQVEQLVNYLAALQDEKK